MLHLKIIQDTLRDLNCPTGMFLHLCDICDNRWAKGLRCQDFSGPELETMMRIRKELSDLADDAQPYRLSFKDAAHIGSLLERRRQGMRWVMVPLGPAHLREQFESDQKEF
jgi:hypothetical protein